MNQKNRTMRMSKARPWSWGGLILLLLITPSLLLASDRVTVIKGATVITGTGEEISSGEVVIEDGKISLVGSQLEIPENARVIEANGLTLIAGMILPRTSQGLLGNRVSGISCDQTVENRWVDEEMDWDSFLEAGYVAAGFVPAGTGFHGQAIVVHTAPESNDRILKKSVFLPVNLSSSSSLHRTVKQAFDGARSEIEGQKKAREKWDKEQEEAKKKAEEAKKKEAENKDSEKGKASDSKEKKDSKDEKPQEYKAPPINPSLKPLVDILENKDEAMPLVFSLNSPGLLLHVDAAFEDIKEMKDRDPQNVFILPSSRTGAFHEVMETLIERKSTVMIPPGVSALPDTYVRYHVPAALSRGGCEVITLPKSDNAAAMRAVPSLLSEQVRFGMSFEAALASVTSAPAKFLGLGDRMGTIEEGKDAHFVLFEGHPLKPGARVMKTIIGGEVVWDREDR
ncbi:MAG: amidohydrolase family protein [Planctomycetia bacterium]|nr:amidohydrolase family protein [Planctomycetia bacterium]MBL6914002.1 amidohydrolase family protein [Planctomycetota bacterium]